MKGQPINSELVRFLIRISTDPGRLERFYADPEAAMAKAKLSRENRARLRSRSAKVISQAFRSLRLFDPICLAWIIPAPPAQPRHPRRRRARKAAR
jgi:hypothetical protein